MDFRNYWLLRMFFIIEFVFKPNMNETPPQSTFAVYFPAGLKFLRRLLTSDVPTLRY
jgi:hypothetical protein